MNNVLPLLVANTIEASRKWEEICQSPQALTAWLIRMLAVDISGIASITEIVKSASEPQGSDRSKLWLKMSDPVGIGVPYDGVYKMIYEYPPNCAVLWTKDLADLPSYFRKLTTSELSSVGLTSPTNGYTWVVMEV